MKLRSLLLPAAVFGREHFHGDKVFRITVHNQRELASFEDLKTDFDLWKEPKQFGDFGDVHVPSQYVDMFEMKLLSHRMNYEIMIDG